MSSNDASVKYDVLGIGNAIMDIIAPAQDAFLVEQNMDKGSMALIDQERALTLNQALKSASNPSEIAGGSAANTMGGIAMLNVKAAYIGKIGKDGVGERLTEGFNDVGLHFDTTPTDTGKASARSMIAVTPDGERTMNTFLGANVDFGVEDINKELIESAGTIYMEGYLFDTDAQKAAFVKAAEIAQAVDRKVSLTLSDSFCVGRHKASFRHLVDNHVDILFANEDEIFALYDTDSLDAALDELTKTKTVACITRSEKGSVIQDETRRYHIKAAAIPGGKIVDTTGAGDQYAAGVLAGRAMGLGWQEAGKIGSLCAAEVISHYGARPEITIDYKSVIS